MTYTSSLLVSFFFMKEPNQNVLVNLTVLLNSHILQSLIFILSKQMLKIKAFFQSPLSTNACLSSTCRHNHIETPLLSQCNKNHPTSLKMIHHALISFLTIKVGMPLISHQ